MDETKEERQTTGNIIGKTVGLLNETKNEIQLEPLNESHQKQPVNELDYIPFTTTPLSPTSTTTMENISSSSTTSPLSPPPIHNIHDGNKNNDNPTYELNPFFYNKVPEVQNSDSFKYSRTTFHPENRKTRLCKDRYLNCRYKAKPEKCFFAHSSTDLQVTFTNERYKNERCTNQPSCIKCVYQPECKQCTNTNGCLHCHTTQPGCKHGDACFFLHDNEKQVRVSECGYCIFIITENQEIIGKLCRKSQEDYKKCQCFIRYETQYNMWYMEYLKTMNIQYHNQYPNQYPNQHPTQNHIQYQNQIPNQYQNPNPYHNQTPNYYTNQYTNQHVDYIDQAQHFWSPVQPQSMTQSIPMSTPIQMQPLIQPPIQPPISSQTQTRSKKEKRRSE